MKIFRNYLRQIEQEYRSGRTTEHTFRPALKDLLESLEKGIEATNEPRRIECGAPDFIITRNDIPLGYIETKDIGISLDDAERTNQLKRYRNSLPNLILTDYLLFRRYVSGEPRQEVRIARVLSDGKIQSFPDSFPHLQNFFFQFLESSSPTVTNSQDLAVRMAGKAQLIRETIGKTFEAENVQGTLHGQFESFRRVLLHDLTPAQFSDMYAQTICYGLFAARIHAKDGERFTREHAAYDLPKTNPFLKKLFIGIAGPELDDRIVWIVNDLAELLNKSDVPSILKDFGKGEGKEDPVVHFYETFLSHYDPRMRELRGVYYTPEPVVSYIVRSVDRLLKDTFKLKKGLADDSKVVLGKGKKKPQTHRVHILDPATGTGTFLYEVIARISESFKGNEGLWPGYVSEHLLPRLHGFELLMAPYAIAHLKLGLELKRLGYDFRSDERLSIYLTNSLEEANEFASAPLFTRWLAEEANNADKVKREYPIMVVLGNPPYSVNSANMGEWIAGLLRGRDSLLREKTKNYFEVDGQPLNEQNPKNLHDDYVKFIRFAQWRIENTGHGILAFITNHGYLDNPTFRGMRQSLMASFDDLYLLVVCN
ncbi:MAG: N-6 DNA methylase [Leptospirillum sp.]